MDADDIVALTVIPFARIDEKSLLQRTVQNTETAYQMLLQSWKLFFRYSQANNAGAFPF